MTAVRFFKMTGSGNDFVFLDGREHDWADWPAERIRGVCDRRRGVGADGIVHLAPLPDGAVRMIYYNADGSHAGMCGNAALCSTRLAVRLGLARPERVELETDAGRLDSRCVGPGWQAELRFPTAVVPGPRDLRLCAGERRAFQGTVGVPHLVLEVDDVAAVPLAARGRELRFAPEAGPEGSNVNFLSRLADADADWAMRTYERGVEGETLACGTGTIAAALAFARAGLLRLPARIRAAGGSVYSVTATLDGDEATDVWLCGEGRLVFTGDLQI
ncbi:MAG: diaminopimelate epimerase [Gemmatimonadales bacterium]